MMMTLRAQSHHSVYPHQRRTALLAALVAAFGALFLIWAPPAAAHTALIKSTPEKDSTVSAVPQVTLVFNEPVRMAKILVRDAGGTMHQQGTPRADGATLTQPVAAGLAPGAYTIAYRVVSSDGHVVEDQFGFTLAGPPGSGSGSQPGPGSASAPAGGASAAPAADAEEGKGAEETKDAGEPGGRTLWSIIMVGLMIGVAIGMGLMFLRKRPGTPDTPGGQSGRSGPDGQDGLDGDQGRADDQQGPSGGN